MSLIVVTFLLLFALIAALSRKRSIVLLCIGLSLIFLFGVGTGLVPRLALLNLQASAPLLEPQWKNQNAIIVLGYGSIRWPQVDHVSIPTLSYSRTVETARLYFDCKKKAARCLIITSGGDPAGNGKTEAELIARDLKSLGIPETDISLESNSNSTFQNAQFVSPLVHGGQFDQVVLVTSGMHMRRALLYFAHFLIQAIPAPSDQFRAIHTLFPSALNMAIMDMALHEYAGLVRYQLYNMMGWNAKPDIKPQT